MARAKMQPRSWRMPLPGPKRDWNRICGLYYLESYCRQLKTGRINRRATPKINVVRLSVLKGHADHGFAQVTFDAAFSQAV
jgi:(2R)-3-sulfolactate dehydrogenase (NADP+)